MSRDSEQVGSLLYGLPGADHLHDDPDDAWQEWADYQDHDPTSDDECIVEKWTVHPPRHHLPRPDLVLEWIEEWAADEVDEGYTESCERIYRDPQVIEAATALLDLIASKVTYWMADRHVASLAVTHDSSGDPVWPPEATP